MTALNEAVIRGGSDVVRVLLAHNASTRCDKEQRSNILCQAIVYNSTDIAHLLIRNGADTNATYTLAVEDGQLELTPRIVAAGCGNLQLVKFLCANGADVERLSNENRMALFFAAAFGKLDVVKYLVSEQNANIQSTNSRVCCNGCSSRVQLHNSRLVCTPPTRKTMGRASFAQLYDADSSLVRVGSLAADAPFWRQITSVDVLLNGDFLQ